MSNKRRIDQVERSLSPKEVMLLWMSEAQKFGSLEAYTRWLADQPDSAHPLVQMPRRVEEGVRRATFRSSRLEARIALRRAHQGLLFFFSLFQDANIEALQKLAALRWRVLLLIARYRSLTVEKETWDHYRLTRFQCAQEGTPFGYQMPASLENHYRREAETWPTYVKDCQSYILAWIQAIDLISRHYFDGRDPLMPKAREEFEQLGTVLDNIRSYYAEDVLYGPPMSDDELAAWLAAQESDETVAATVPTDGQDHSTELVPEAKAIAERFILWARVKALDMVDEPGAAEDLARLAVHKEDGSYSESVRQAGAGAGRLNPH